jgi:F-actin capping protein, beta subunit
MDIVSSMLDLMRRLPPTKIEENVEALMRISPDYADDLSGNVDQPLKLRVDRATGKEYLACVYNQDGESYRCVKISHVFAQPSLSGCGVSPTINERGVPLHAAMFVQVALVQ